MLNALTIRTLRVGGAMAVMTVMTQAIQAKIQGKGMRIAGDKQRLLMLLASSLVMLSGVNVVLGESITTPILSLTGTVNPVTYTDSTGTFTTSPISLSLSDSAPSSFTADLSTLVASDHTVMNVSFNNGKPGNLNSQLSGVLTVDESGPITSLEANQEFTADLTIQSAVLSGAGEFNGTTLTGKNPTIKDFSIEWKFGPGSSGAIDAHLPAGFASPVDIPLSGDIVASVPAVPEANAGLLLLSVVGAVLFLSSRRLWYAKPSLGAGDQKAAGAV